MTNAMAVFLLRFAASVAVLALWACSGDNFAPGPNGASQALVSAPVAATGTEIIFSSNVRDWFVTDVYSMRADGAATEPRIEGPAQAAVIHYSAPAWSPDAARIAMTHSEMGRHFWLAVANADGSGLADVAVGGVTPAWSPDGSVIAFGSRDCRQSDRCIRFARPDGPGSATTIENAYSPAWRP